MFSSAVIAKVKKTATEIDVEAAALLAVGEVESAGNPMWDVAGEKLPPIRFEGHYFHKRLKGDKLAAAVAAGLANPKAGAVKNPGSYGARYALLERAARIDKQAAYESTSWGLGQVMGAHWKKLGYGSVDALVAAAKSGVDGQIAIMAKYILKFGLVDELQTKGWQSFADQYNGPASRKNRYGEKIAAAYKNYVKVLAGSVTSDGIPADGNDTIRHYQRDLKRLGFYKGEVDGVAGARTKAAVKALQKANGLVADGKYGKMTDEVVDRLIAALDRSGGDTAVKTGTGITGTGAVVDIIKEQTDTLQSVADYSHIITYAVIALVVIGVALTLVGVWKKYKAGMATDGTV
jgi:hypothetical protein